MDEDENEAEAKAKAKKEKTVLVAVNNKTKEARLLPYTLADVEELIELGQCMVDQDDVPEDLRAEFKTALDRLGGH